MVAAVRGGLVQEKSSPYARVVRTRAADRLSPRLLLPRGRLKGTTFAGQHLNGIRLLLKVVDPP